MPRQSCPSLPRPYALTRPCPTPPAQACLAEDGYVCLLAAGRPAVNKAVKALKHASMRVARMWGVPGARVAVVPEFRDRGKWVPASELAGGAGDGDEAGAHGDGQDGGGGLEVEECDEGRDGGAGSEAEGAGDEVGRGAREQGGGGRGLDDGPRGPTQPPTRSNPPPAHTSGADPPDARRTRVARPPPHVQLHDARPDPAPRARPALPRPTPPRPALALQAACTPSSLAFYVLHAVPCFQRMDGSLVLHPPGNGPPPWVASLLDSLPTGRPAAWGGGGGDGGGDGAGGGDGGAGGSGAVAGAQLSWSELLQKMPVAEGGGEAAREGELGAPLGAGAAGALPALPWAGGKQGQKGGKGKQSAGTEDPLTQQGGQGRYAQLQPPGLPPATGQPKDWGHGGQEGRVQPDAARQGRGAPAQAVPVQAVAQGGLPARLAADLLSAAQRARRPVRSAPAADAGTSAGTAPVAPAAAPGSQGAGLNGQGAGPRKEGGLEKAAWVPAGGSWPELEFPASAFDDSDDEEDEDVGREGAATAASSRAAARRARLAIASPTGEAGAVAPAAGPARRGRGAAAGAGGEGATWVRAGKAWPELEFPAGALEAGGAAGGGLSAALGARLGAAAKPAAPAGVKRQAAPPPASPAGSPTPRAGPPAAFPAPPAAPLGWGAGWDSGSLGQDALLRAAARPAVRRIVVSADNASDRASIADITKVCPGLGARV